MRSLTAVLVLMTLGVTTDASLPGAFVYRFSDVKSKVILDHAAESVEVVDGATGLGGDIVRTGWRGRAVVAVAERGSRFEIRSGSRVRLASERPGVLVLLERGSLKAFFDKLTGDDERLVETPGALLAVRGTRYGLEVDADGNAAVAVFEGHVEILPFDSEMAPVLIGPGEVGVFGPGIAPEAMHRGMNESAWNRHGVMGDIARGMGADGMSSPGMGGMSGPGKGTSSTTHKPHG